MEEAALEQAETQCLADEDARRSAPRARPAAPCGPGHAVRGTTGRGRRVPVPRLPAQARRGDRQLRRRGRGAAAGSAARPLGVRWTSRRFTLAVVASVRHQDTDYDELLMSGAPRAWLPASRSDPPSIGSWPPGSIHSQAAAENEDAMKPPADQALAAAATPLRQVQMFIEWVDAGRELTQPGRITLADARELVGLLGTADEIDPKIGGRVFRTRSGEELPGSAVAPPNHAGSSSAGAGQRRRTDRHHQSVAQRVDGDHFELPRRRRRAAPSGARPADRQRFIEEVTEALAVAADN